MTQLWWNSNSTCRATYWMHIPSFKLISQSTLKKSPENSDGRTDGRTDGHCHSIIRPFFKRAYKKRDELTAHKQLKSILVTSSYIRLTMLFQGQGHGQGQSWQLTKSNALHSIDELVFCFMATGPPIPDVWLVKRHDRAKVKVMAKVKNWKPHLRPSVQSMRYLSVSWQLDFFYI